MILNIFGTKIYSHCCSPNLTNEHDQHSFLESNWLLLSHIESLIGAIKFLIYWNVSDQIRSRQIWLIAFFLIFAAIFFERIFSFILVAIRWSLWLAWSDYRAAQSHVGASIKKNRIYMWNRGKSSVVDTNRFPPPMPSQKDEKLTTPVFSAGKVLRVTQDCQRYYHAL